MPGMTPAVIHGDRARRYLQPDDPYYNRTDKLFAWKIARHCAPEDLPFCLEVGNPKDIDGIPYNDFAIRKLNWKSTPTTGLGIRRVCRLPQLHGTCYGGITQQRRARVGQGNLFWHPILSSLWSRGESFLVSSPCGWMIVRQTGLSCRQETTPNKQVDRNIKAGPANGSAFCVIHSFAAKSISSPIGAARP